MSKPEVGQIYEGKVVKILDFGAIVNFFAGCDGMVHISEIAPHRIDKVSDVLSVGDQIKVKLIGIDTEKNRYKLSIKKIDN